MMMVHYIPANVHHDDDDNDEVCFSSLPMIMIMTQTNTWHVHGIGKYLCSGGGAFGRLFYWDIIVRNQSVVDVPCLIDSMLLIICRSGRCYNMNL
mmetsp:Transcript_7624/g.8832  ORF Transcript_7624/g.8832 Transcript_7624/m.8832 type:complete len:95 (-) Transcript_7624:284-568(-)